MPTLSMRVLIFPALTFLFYSSARSANTCSIPRPEWRRSIWPNENPADKCPKWGLKRSADKWLVENPAFMRLGNESDPVSTTHVGFNLYYPKWSICNTSVSTRTDSSCSSGPELCGLDTDISDRPARCGMYYDDDYRRTGRVPHPNTLLWRPCQGRWQPPVKMPENCKGLTYDEVRAGVRGCQYTYRPDVEDESERLWAKWRIAAFKNIPKLYSGAENKPWSTLESITIEVVNGQQ